MSFTKTTSCKHSLLTVLLLLTLQFCNTAQACDSSMLEILTGASTQQTIVAKILVVSQKMQQAANLLKSFNHAAASKIHREVLENWLYIASQIATNPPGLATDSSEFSYLLMQIAQDLGKVRRKLDSSQLDYIHEILEASITRMSLVSAIMNGQHKVREFLEIELLLYGPRPFFNDLNALNALASSSSLIANLQKLQPQLASETAMMVPLLINSYEAYLESLHKDQDKISSTTQTAFQSLLNQFVKFKQTLLNVNYFKPKKKL